MDELGNFMTGTRATGFFWVFALWLAGCAALSKDRRESDSSAGPWVERLELQGNRAFTDSEIADGLSLHEPIGLIFQEKTRFDPLLLEADAQRVRALYQRKGYFQAVVQGSVTRSDQKEVDLRFAIQEGPRAEVTAVQLEGTGELQGVTQEELRGRIGIAVGDGFVHERLAQAKDALRRFLGERGYPLAQVQGTARVNQARTSVEVRLEVQTGKRLRFGNASVEGASRVPRQAVLDRIEWKQGEIYDPERLEDTRQGLLRLGQFQNVQFDLHPTGDVADIRITLTESLRHVIKLGVGAGIDKVHYELRGRMSYDQQGFLLPLLTLRTELQPSYQFQKAFNESAPGFEAQVSLIKDDFLFPLLRAGQAVAYRVEAVEAYSLKGPRLRTFLERAYEHWNLLASVGWNFRYQGLTPDPIIPKDRFAELGLQDPYQLGFFDQTVSIDLRDDVFEPTRGLFAALRLEEGGRVALGKFAYVKIMPELRAYLPLPWRTVLASKVLVGGMLSDTRVLPITQRYYAGGASSQRGFFPQRLSPWVSDADGHRVPIGGRALVEASVELRARLVSLWGGWLGAVVFLDGADVVLAFDQLSLKNLHWAVGPGLRYQTPVGLIRLDVGFRLNRRGAADPDPAEGFAFHLSLGESF